MDAHASDAGKLNDIERDIEATRQNIGHTLDALHEKLSIRRRMSHTAQQAGDRGKALITGASRWIKEHPAAVVVVAAPILFFLSTKAVRSYRGRW